MPGWLRVVATVNPLTYLVDALRGLMVEHAQTLHGPIGNFAFLGIVFVFVLAVATKVYPSLAQ
jgi:ABC-2 type transport system permease protein